MQNRWEQAWGDVLTDGKLTINENGFQGEADAPSSVLLAYHGLHLDIRIDRSTPIGGLIDEYLRGRLELPDEAVRWLQVVPYKGSLPTSVPTDPLIYRFYELVSVYGTTFKELIHEEFGDGIMSAIDFKMDLQREPDPKGDRVSIVMSGKFLPYKTY